LHDVDSYNSKMPFERHERLQMKNLFYTTPTPTSDLIHPVFPDLVNNFVYYHNAPEMETHENKVWTNLPPNYLNYPLLETMLPEIIANPQRFIDNGSITVRCPVSQFYTCDGKLAGLDDVIGYDRLWKYKEIISKSTTRIKACDGYSSRADLLHGMVRWIFDADDNPIGIAICKDRGNFRTHVAVESTGGKDVMLAITLDFHECDPKLTDDDMRAIEASTFTEDAVHRRGFDPETKFRAGYVGNEIPQLAQYGWLDGVNIDFAGVVTKERLAAGKTPPKYSLSSLSKLDFGTDGKAYNEFAKYGEVNVNAAVGTAMRIHDKLNLGTVISVTLVHVITRTFWFMTEHSSKFKLGEKSSWNALWDRKNLQDFLVWYYTYTVKDRRGNDIVVNNLAEISGRSGADKDLSWRAFDTYLPAVLKEYCEEKGRQNKVGSDAPAIRAYINSIEIEGLKKEAIRELDIAA